MSQPQSSEEWNELDTGQVIKTHSKQVCSGDYCSIHNPSPAAEAIGFRYWRKDRAMMERICDHGVGHPDPDELAFLARIGWTTKKMGVHSVHGCDGCCQGAYDHLWPSDE